MGVTRACNARKGHDMSIRDRRRLGVTFIAVLRAAKELVHDPDFCPQSRRQMAESILERITGMQRVQAVGEGFDWEALLDFIMELLPVILEIISIFL